MSSASNVIGDLWRSHRSSAGIMTACAAATVALLAVLLPGRPVYAAQQGTAGVAVIASDTIRINDTVLPNFNGIWLRRGSFLFDPAVRDPLKLNPPYKPDWMKAFNDYRQNVARTGEITLDPTARCLPPGMPRIMNAVYPLEILMTPGQVTMIEEWMGETRRIYTDGRKHPDDPDITYIGDSTGHWEKDGTLVIDTIAMEPDTLLDQSGMKHSAAMHVVERMKLLSPQVLQNQLTLEDPVAFTHPWTVTRTFDRAKPGEEIREFVCEQNNRNPIGPNGSESVILENDGHATTVPADASRQPQPAQKP